MQRTLVSNGNPMEKIVGFARAVRVGPYISVGGTARPRAVVGARREAYRGRADLSAHPIGGNMNFRLVCVLAWVVTGLFGLAFFLAPEATGAFYGIEDWNPGTTGIARYLGTAFLFTAAAAYAVSPTTDASLQRRFAGAFSFASLIGALLSVQLVLSGSVNALGWSSVLIYVFFAAAWFFATRRKA